MIFEFLECLLSKSFLSIDQIIRNSVMIVPHLTIFIVNLDKFLEITLWIVLLVGRTIMLNRLEMIWESSSHEQFILPIFVVAPYLFGYEPFVVFINGDSLD